MKRPVDLARRFLALADQDIKAFEKLVGDREIGDAVIGFHAQQAVEKCLKAVLAQRQVPVGKIHDLHALLELLTDKNPSVPPMKEEIVELNPFAVILRYELMETEELDRALAGKIVAEVRQWAEQCLSQ